MCQAAHAIIHSMMSRNVPRMAHSTFQIERSLTTLSGSCAPIGRQECMCQTGQTHLRPWRLKIRSQKTVCIGFRRKLHNVVSEHCGQHIAYQRHSTNNCLKLKFVLAVWKS